MSSGTPSELATWREQLANTFETLPIALLVADDEGRYVAVNDAACSLTGFSREELLRKTVLDVTPSANRAAGTALWADFIRAGKLEGRYELVRKDGSTVTTEFRAVAQVAPGCHVSVLRDVCDELTATHALVETEELLKKRLEQSRRLYALTDRLSRTQDPRVVFDEALDCLVACTGAARASILLADPDGVVRFKAWRGLSDEYRRAVEGHVPWAKDAREWPLITVTDTHLEPGMGPYVATFDDEAIRALAFVPLIAGDRLLGKFMLYHAVPHAFTAEELELARTVAAHVTLAVEKRRQDDELRRSRDELAAILETERFLSEASRLFASTLEYEETLATIARLAVPRIADWCVVDLVRPDGSFESDPVAVAHTDPSKSEIAREYRRKHPIDREARRGVPNVVRTGKSELYEVVEDSSLVSAARDAEHLAVLRQMAIGSAMVVPLLARGRTLGAVTFVTSSSGRRYAPKDLALAEDLAHRAALAVENAQLYREVRRADEAKGDFLAMLAHELRNPLAPISTATQLLALKTRAVAGIDKPLAVVDRQVKHLARLVDDLLDVSRIARGKVQLRREPLDLTEVVRTTVEDYRAAASAASIALELELPTAPLPVNGDALRLTQALGNLLQNAIKFSERGGRVRVRASEDGGARARVTVADQGIGIAPDVLVRLFEPFTQADRTLDRSRGGLGLGLAVVRGLVELHGGTVSATSAGVGRGSEFSIVLPLDATVAKKPAPDGAPAPAAGRCVLIIEDNRDAADTLRELLELDGHRVAVAYDGEAGVEAARRVAPEIILCDIGLPRLDGFAVAATLRRDERMRHVHLVALSGYGQEEDRARAKAAGFDRHLTKPVDPDELMKVLASSAP